MALVEGLSGWGGALTGLGNLAGSVIPALQQAGVFGGAPPIMNLTQGWDQAQPRGYMPALSGNIYQENAPPGTWSPPLQLPAVAGGVAGAAGCITPVTSMTTRLPRTVDVTTADAAGNTKVHTYVKAPRPTYKVTMRARRRCRGR